MDKIVIDTAGGYANAYLYKWIGHGWMLFPLYHLGPYASRTSAIMFGLTGAKARGLTVSVIEVRD